MTDLQPEVLWISGMRNNTRRAHPDAYFAELKADAQKTSHTLWSDLENENMGKLELRLKTEGKRFINKEFALLLPERTADAIKGKRKASSYQDVLKRITESFQTPPAVSPLWASTDPVMMEVHAEQPTHAALPPEPSITVSLFESAGPYVPDLDPDATLIVGTIY